MILSTLIKYLNKWRRSWNVFWSSINSRTKNYFCVFRVITILSGRRRQCKYLKIPFSNHIDSRNKVITNSATLVDKIFRNSKTKHSTKKHGILCYFRINEEIKNIGRSVPNGDSGIYMLFSEIK